MDRAAIEAIIQRVEDFVADGGDVETLIDNANAALVDPPVTERRFLHPGHTLEGIIATLERRVIPDAPAPSSVGATQNLRQAVRNARDAHQLLTGQEPDEGRALRSLEHAIRHVGSAARLGGLGETVAVRRQRDLAGVARGVAELSIRRLERAGADRARIALLERDLSVADGLIENGDFSGGFDVFEDIGDADDDLVFSFEQFELNIRNQLASTDIAGYSYAISDSGQLWSSTTDAASGFARWASDSPETPHSPTKKMNIASLSKTITAVAMLNLLRDTPGVDLDSPIGPYLPPDWMVDPSNAQLTFRQLMQQRSGMLGAGNAAATDYDTMAVYMFLGAMGTNYEYENANFGIMRVALPYVWGILPETFGAELKIVTAAIYIYYVQTTLFEPIGIMDADCDDPRSDRTLQYTLVSEGLISWDPGDWTLVCGGGGWYLSAVDVANFLAHVRYDNSYLHPDDRIVMNAEYLGWMDATAWNFFDGDWGVYRGHGGDLRNRSSNMNPFSQIDTCHMNFPNGAQAVLFVNSRMVSLFGTPLPYQCRLLTDAYDAAWSL